MPLCTFASGYHMMDVTPVENLFIQEFMLKAPGDFVKVYIYGLNQCYQKDCCNNSIGDFARALGLEDNVVENAFRYWERQGILKIREDLNSGFQVEYFNIKDILYNSNFSAENALYQYKEFNQNLQMIFGNRLLTPQEYLKIYDWLEVFNLPKEVVLMMIRFYLSKKGSKLSINYLDKIAESWAKDGINTLQKAEEYIQSFESYYQDTIAVLKYLGIHRSPSKAELELYKKWSGKWGFCLNSILLTCKETTKIQSPNMAYLDKILESFNKMGLKIPQEIEHYLSSRESINNKIKDLLFHFGHKDSAPTPEHHSLYLKWTREWNLSHDTVLLACRLCVRKKRNTFEKLDALLKYWMDLGLHTPEDIRRYQNELQITNQSVKEVLTRAGTDQDITPGTRSIYLKWIQKWNHSHESILLAAEYACSANADNKITFMNKILYNWYQKGITTLKEAKQEHEQHIQALQPADQDKGLKKQVDFNKFDQRTYTDDELDHLFEDIENA